MTGWKPIPRFLVMVFCFALALSVFLFLQTQPWQWWDIDSNWAAQVLQDSEEVRENLDDFWKKNGKFPDSLDEIDVGFNKPTDFSDRDSTDRWHYRKLDDSDYELYAVGKSFASSFDAMVFRHSGDYPGHWFDSSDGSHAKEYGNWWYITGFSSLEPSR